MSTTLKRVSCTVPGGGGGAGALRFFLLSDVVPSAIGAGISALNVEDDEEAAALCTISELSIDEASMLVFVLALSCVFVDSLDEFPGDSSGDMFASSNPLECELFLEWWSLLCSFVTDTVNDSEVDTLGVGATAVAAPGGGGGAGAFRFVRGGLLGIFAPTEEALLLLAEAPAPPASAP